MVAQAPGPNLRAQAAAVPSQRTLTRCNGTSGETPRQHADPVQVLQIIARIGRLPKTAYCLNKRCRQDLEQLTLSGGFAGDVRQSALLARLTSVTLHRVHHDPPFDAALAALPPSVTSLTLDGDVSLTEEKLDDGSLQRPQAPAWPPSLTALTIRDAACRYALPPTLLHLALEVTGANADARDVPCLTDFSSYALPAALETLSIATRGKLRALPAALPPALRQMRVAAGAVHKHLVALPPLPASLKHVTLSCPNWGRRSLGPLPAALQELELDCVSFDASVGALPPTLRVLKFHPLCRFGECWFMFIQFLVVLTGYLLTLGTLTFYTLKRMRPGSLAREVTLWLLWACGVAAPFLFLVFGGITNYVLRLVLAIEAIFGTTPPGVLDTLSNWLVYFGAVIEPIYENGRPCKPLPGQLLQHVGLMLCKAALFSGLMTLGLSGPLPLMPFGATFDGACGGGFWRCLALRMGNNALHAAIICVLLGTLANALSAANFARCNVQGSVRNRSPPAVTLGAAAIAAAASLNPLSLRHLMSAAMCAVGYRPVDVMRNPLLLSLSPREFWGRRWNLLIHGILKRTYSRPVSKRYGAMAGAAAAFCVSGLFHEFKWNMMFYGAPRGVYRFGEVLWFFALMFALCCAPWPDAERLVKEHPWCRPLLTVATILPGLLAAQWFTRPWIEAEVFQAFGQLIPMVVLDPLHEPAPPL
ncbi:hypothetical protein JKP88DRAFT_353218 [Tribonema minus]|uniref:Wax synthase domain-containing protein n=1 Tax=Tribonema minus TaxID=303371 RepID=A0A835ZCW0_9STRA|nr:hypothetical protein JKP88DRAFT_353218 [Tribonema minus]